MSNGGDKLGVVNGAAMTNIGAAKSSPTDRTANFDISNR